MSAMMADFGFWGDLALRAWINVNPSSLWANQMIEPYRGLPFGVYLHSPRPARRRTLTGPIDNSGRSLWHKMQLYSNLESEQRTDEQADCGFLSKLPIDIRLIIYDMVLGGNFLHLSADGQKRSRITHYVCPTPSKVNACGYHICSQPCSRPSTASPREMYEQATGLLPLLVTCRRIYSEAINTLYAANTFEFTQNFAAFSFLKLMIPPQRLPYLRHFRLYLRIPRHPASNSRATRDWTDLWRFFADEMSGLQSLYLELQMLHYTEADIESTSDDAADVWMMPIVLMTLKANVVRACKVEIATRRVRHEPLKLFKEVARKHSQARPEEILRLTCAMLHERIRISLGAHT